MSKKSPVHLAKEEIQELARQVVIARDGGCIYRDVWQKHGLSPCNGYAGEDNHLVLQADHLVSRGKNVGFADTRLIVCTCKGHHTAKTFDKSNVYEPIIRELMGEERTKLWDKARKDRRMYHKTAWDWQKEILALKQELKSYNVIHNSNR